MNKILEIILLAAYDTKKDVVNWIEFNLDEIAAVVKGVMLLGVASVAMLLFAAFLHDVIGFSLFWSFIFGGIFAVIVYHIGNLFLKNLAFYWASNIKNEDADDYIVNRLNRRIP